MATPRSSGSPAGRRRPAARTSDKPPAVGFNLDTWEREDDGVDVFTPIIGGKPRPMANPVDLDWQELIAALQDPRILLRVCMFDDDADEILSMKMTAAKLNKLITEWRNHYGLTDEVLKNGGASLT